MHGFAAAVAPNTVIERVETARRTGILHQKAHIGNPPSPRSPSNATSRMETTLAACRTEPQCTTGKYMPAAQPPPLVRCRPAERARRFRCVSNPPSACPALLGLPSAPVPQPTATLILLAAAQVTDGEAAPSARPVAAARGEAPPSDVRPPAASERLPERHRASLSLPLVPESPPSS